MITYFVMHRQGTFKPVNHTPNQCKEFGHSVYHYRLKLVFDGGAKLNEQAFLVDHQDLCGTHDGTLAALRAAQAPLIGVHDYQRQSCPGVATAVEASGYRVIERVDSLVILERSQSETEGDAK